MKTDGSGPFWTVRDSISRNNSDGKKERTELNILVVTGCRNQHRSRAADKDGGAKAEGSRRLGFETLGKFFS
ncbi:hypothetical protein V6N12_005640 [Hibiscus sabdariffa]|uniref:Uncharacterized protein n=1 Tax=Hibiscus sabdariffa TaxID=183260 RepID=A0ABR2BCC0_9ROSI